MKILDVRWAAISEEGWLISLSRHRDEVEFAANSERAYRRRTNKLLEKPMGKVRVRRVTIVEGDLTQEGK